MERNGWFAFAPSSLAIDEFEFNWISISNCIKKSTENSITSITIELVECFSCALFVMCWISCLSVITMKENVTKRANNTRDIVQLVWLTYFILHFVSMFQVRRTFERVMRALAYCVGSKSTHISRAIFISIDWHPIRSPKMTTTQLIIIDLMQFILARDQRRKWRKMCALEIKTEKKYLMSIAYTNW